MKFLNKITKFIALLLIIVMQFVFIPLSQKAYAATAPNLGLAAGYSVFGNAGITETPAQTSHLWGNAGGNGFGYASLIAGQVDGSIDPGANGPVVSAISSAYGDLAGQGLTGAIDLATSPTVVPGVYDIAATAFSSTLTLNGAGVYIFRSSSSIAQTAGGTMNLIGDACASNVYWQIPAAMTFAATGSIDGTIIAGTLISFVSGTSLKGRAWAGTQVTMDNNQITEPASCASPTATPTPTSSSTSSSGGSSSTSTASCPDLSSQIVTPIIIDSKRINANSISINWGPYSGTDTFSVRYGPTNGNWPYSTTVTGFSTYLNALPSNQPIWVQVAARSDCRIGNYGEAKLVGGQTLIAVNPNVLGVSFPDTGFSPRQDNIPWYVFVSILAGISALFVSIQRKHKSS